MLGSYPSLSLHDPETYIGVICTLLCGYPLWAGSKALEQATCSDECKFVPPTPGILKPFLEAEVRTTRYAAEWDRTAEHILALPAPDGPSAEERRAFIESRLARDGPHFGIGTWKNDGEPTLQDLRGSLIAQIGQEAFDAIPDAPPRQLDEWGKLKPPIGKAAE